MSISYLDDPELMAKSDTMYRVAGGTVYARALHHIAQDERNYAKREGEQECIRMLKTRKGMGRVFRVNHGQRYNWVPTWQDENAADWQLGTEES